MFKGHKLVYSDTEFELPIVNLLNSKYNVLKVNSTNLKKECNYVKLNKDLSNYLK